MLNCSYCMNFLCEWCTNAAKKDRRVSLSGAVAVRLPCNVELKPII